VLTIDGVQVTETPAVMTRLAALYPTARLLPTGDPVIENDALAMTCWTAGVMHPPITRMRYPQRFCDLPECRS
jgi:glutathione S-transferase